MKINLWDTSYSSPNKRQSDWRYPPRGIKNTRYHWRHLTFWNRPEWQEIKLFLQERKRLGHNIFPSSYPKMFRCLEECSFQDTRIVILGQDPYPTKGMADGLAFSVLPSVQKIPGSLANILLEYRNDLGFSNPRTGNLGHWSRRGILLMNSIWSVEEDKGGGHEHINGKRLWSLLTTECLEQLSKRKDKLVFILWGKHAQEWGNLLDTDKHLIIKGVHPSPRNAGLLTTGFFGGKYFSKAAEYLDIDPRIWRLP